jgi:glycine/serine hydroxymethyltransferase
MIKFKKLRLEQPNDYCETSAYSRDMDFERFRVIADSVGAFTC